MRVLLLGGTGFIGRAALAALSRCPDTEILVLSRHAGKTPLGVAHKVDAGLNEAPDHPDVLAFAPEVIVDLAGSIHPRASNGLEAQMLAQEVAPFHGASQCASETCALSTAE